MRVEIKTVVRPLADVGGCSDEDLQLRARAGDIEAFGELVKRYCAAVA